MKNFRRAPVRLIMIALLATAMGAAHAADAALNLYVSPNGDDSAPGTSESRPLKSLGRALAAYQSDCNARPSRIVLAGGSYGNEQATLRSAPCPLVISSASGQATFDGGGNGQWLTLALPGAKMVDVTITGMNITNYQSAISINGNRNDPQGWIGGIKIVKNRFSHIGSFRADQPPATAAVRLVNARSVIIEGNEFETIRNVTHCGGLHSVYIAHHSTENRIVGNSFVDGCGETIKVRDSSDSNLVERNRFERQEGSALFLDSYCDASAGGECTKAEPECPSWNNVFRDNTIVGVRPDSNKKTTGSRKAARALPANCAAPRGAERMREERGSSTR